MVPAGEITEKSVDEVADAARAGRRDHRRRQLPLPRRHPPRPRLAERGIDYIDCGTSGGVFGPRARLLPDDRRPRRGGGAARPDLRRGRPRASRRPSGPRAARATPSPAEQGYLHCGPSGAGHFVKMVHNGIEYGLMAAYAEGLNILANANAGKVEREADAETAPLAHPEHYQYDIDVAEVAEVWRRGSVDRLLAARPRPPPRCQDPRSWRSSRAGSRTRARAAGPRSRRSRRACRRRC